MVAGQLVLRPVAGEDQPVDGRLLRRAKGIDSRARGKGRLVFHDDPRSEQIGGFDNRPDLGQFREDRIANRVLVESQKLVRGADDQLQILAFIPVRRPRLSPLMTRTSNLRPARLAPGSPCG